ncbi:MAG: hypothetical protein IJO85_02145 [Lachnospiraceae bacterium]|nr:hypothetical protein [Lachnospiraceae bacterium]
MMIAITAMKEKVRRKDLYIVGILGLVLVLLFCSGGGTITIDGEPISGYKNLAPIMLILINALGGALAIALSLRTIPNEYERRTSHLIWIRGVKQWRYHAELTIANVASSLIATGIMYAGLAVLALVKNQGDGILRMVPAFFVLAISIAIVSVLSSVLSIFLPSMAAGILAGGCFAVGVLHSILGMVANTIGGFSGNLIKIVLVILPDLHGIQKQAGNLITGSAVDAHVIWKGLLTIYILTIGFFIFKKKEA